MNMQTSDFWVPEHLTIVRFFLLLLLFYSPSATIYKTMLKVQSWKYER